MGHAGATGLLGRGGRLGLGTAQLGNLFEPVSDAAAAEVVAAAWEGGIRCFDTAPHYGLGLAERRLGDALRGLPRDEFVVSTKAGRLLEDVGVAAPDDAGFAVTSTLRRRWDFSREGIRRSLEASLGRLGLDRVDVLYLHDPDDHWAAASTTGIAALHELKREGLVSAIGVGMNQSAMPARFIREFDLDVVMVAGRVTLLDRSGIDELLPAARARGVDVVAAAVFNSGVLSSGAATYDYLPASADVRERARRMADVCARFGVPLPVAALRYPLRHEGVVALVAGMSTPEQVRANVAGMDADVPDGLWAALEAEGLLERARDDARGAES